jgi:hypothetical protein
MWVECGVWGVMCGAMYAVRCAVHGCGVCALSRWCASSVRSGVHHRVRIASLQTSASTHATSNTRTRQMPTRSIRFGGFSSSMSDQVVANDPFFRSRSVSFSLVVHASGRTKYRHSVGKFLHFRFGRTRCSQFELFLSVNSAARLNEMCSSS